MLYTPMAREPGGGWVILPLSLVSLGGGDVPLVEKLLSILRRQSINPAHIRLGTWLDRWLAVQQPRGRHCLASCWAALWDLYVEPGSHGGRRVES